MRTQNPDIPALAAGFIATHPKVDPVQQHLMVAALRLLAEGQPFEPDTLAARADLPSDEVAEYLDEWPMVERDDHGRVLAFAGLTLKPTSHVIEIDGRTLYAWCALDTLFLPELLGKTARIRSTAPVTGETISVVVDGSTVRQLSPESAMLTLQDADGYDIDDVIGTFCNFVHFFPSPQAAQAWADKSPGTYVVSVADGFELGRHYNHERLGAVVGADALRDAT